MTLRTITASTAGLAGAATLSFTVPTVVAGELCTVFVATNNQTVVPTTPAGFTAQGTATGASAMTVYVWSKILAATDSGSTVSVTYPTGSARIALVATLDTGTDGTVTLSAATVVASGTSVSAPTVTTSVAGSIVRTLTAARNGVTPFTTGQSPSAADVSRAEIGTTSTTVPNVDAMVADQTVAVAGVVAAQTITAATASAPFIAFTQIIVPQAAAPAPPAGRIPGTSQISVFLAGRLWPLTVRGLWDGTVERRATFTFTKTAAAPPPPPPATGFKASGLVGGGFQNVVAESPFLLNGFRPVAMGSDVSGPQISLDGAKTWTPHPSGLDNHVAAICWDQVTPGKLFCLVGNGTGVAGTGGGALGKSLDYGVTWVKQAAPASADGNGIYVINGVEHPRPTGDLIVIDSASAHMWVASTDGVRMTTDEGATWSGPVAFTGDHLRGMAWNPNSPDTLYVAVHNGGTGSASPGDPTRNGVWQITDARTTMSAVSKVGTWPTTRGAEELVIDDNAGVSTLYAVAHDAGVFSWDGANWTARNNGLDLSGMAYCSIDERRSAGVLTLVVSGGYPRSSQLLFRSVDGGLSWACISTGAGVVVSSNDYGTTVPAFISQISYLNWANGQFAIAALEISADDPNRIVMSGRGGARIATFSGSTWTVQPSTQGLMVTVNMFVAANPLVAGRAMVGSMDYTMNITADSGKTFTAGTMGASGAQTTGDCGTYASGGPLPLAAVVGASLRGSPTSSAGNGVYLSVDPGAVPPVWIKQPFPVGSTADTLDVPGVGMSRTGPGGTQVILATVTNSGVWRKQGTATWTQISDFGIAVTGRNNGTFESNPNTATIYFHGYTGLWRSDQSGADSTWTQIFTTPATYAIMDSIRVDPINPAVLYVSRGAAGVVRLDNASTSTSAAATTVTPLTGNNAGPIAITAGGNLYVSLRAGGLLQFTSPRTSPISTDVANQFWRDNARSIRSMDITLDNVLLTADNGQGCIAGPVT